VKRDSALDGNALRTRRTVERILAASLRLFNEHGEARVTLGQVADALDMSPGNLYYHFRNKDAVVLELFRRFEARMDIAPRADRDAAQAIEDLWLFLHLLLEAIWEYRFLYRNLDDLVRRNRRLGAAFDRILERKTAAVAALCETLARAGAMTARPEEIRALARNVVIVATYWLNFQAVRGRRDEPSPHDLGEGAFQVLALIAPYLVGDARRHLEALSRRYIE
jgi:AcrR family transcriptional regulator